MRKNPFSMKLRKLSLLFSYYVYLDVGEYLADKLFIDHKVRVHYGDEFSHPNGLYRLIHCHVRKKDEAKFLEALDELPGRVILCGYPKFEAEGTAIWKMFDNVDHNMDGKELRVSKHETDGAL